MAERYLRTPLIIGCVSPDYLLKKERKKERKKAICAQAPGRRRDSRPKPGVRLTSSQVITAVITAVRSGPRPRPGPIILRRGDTCDSIHIQPTLFHPS